MCRLVSGLCAPWRILVLCDCSFFAGLCSCCFVMGCGGFLDDASTHGRSRRRGVGSEGLQVFSQYARGARGLWEMDGCEGWKYKW